MFTEVTGTLLSYLLVILLAYPLGNYISKTFSGSKTFMDFLNPIEKFIYKCCSINAAENMNWKQFLRSMLTINMLWLVYAFVLLLFQDKLPLNPDHNAAQSADLAFNTSISFLVNCNLQHYSGETGLTYFTQLFVITFLQFVSAATGIACLIALFNGIKSKTTTVLGNFWVLFIKSITRLLLPISVIIALILAFNGTPSGFEGKDTIVTLQGDTVQVSKGPAAAMIAIKHLGTNGGGWFGANSAHPFENPSYYTAITELMAQLLIPIALIFAMGFYLRRKKLCLIIFGTMTIGFLMLALPAMYWEMAGNPAISQMGILQNTGSMEGKEVRFGAAISGFWSIATTVISTGSVNSMHDSSMPLSGLMQLLAMLINAFYGGCGVGLLNYFIYIIIAVFIGGLMVGRTPELFGHKVEAREIKIAALVTLLSAFLVKGGTALAAYIFTQHGNADWATTPANWLNNPGYHGFSEMLYEFTSANANNGSGFEGLSDNNIFWNISTGIILLLGRFIPIIGPVAIIGLLARKKYIPASPGTLKIDSVTFSLLTFGIILIITALSYFPALVLGPIAEYVNMP
jgi:K+-transporting ATPase ATPase A chain